MEDQSLTKADFQTLDEAIAALINQVAALPNQIAEALKGRGRRREPRRVQHGANKQTRNIMNSMTVAEEETKCSYPMVIKSMVSDAKEETKCSYPVVIKSMISDAKEEESTPREALKDVKDYKELTTDELTNDIPHILDIQHQLTPDESSKDLPLMPHIEHKIDVIPKSTLPDLTNYHMSLKENIIKDMPIKNKVCKEGEYVVALFDKIRFPVEAQNQLEFNNHDLFTMHVIIYPYENMRHKKPQPSIYGCPYQVDVIRYPEKNSRSSSSEVEESDAGAFWLFSFSIFLVLLLWFYGVFPFLVFTFFMDFLIF